MLFLQGDTMSQHCKDNTYPKLVQVRPSRHHAGMVRQGWRESSLTTAGTTGVVLRQEEL